MPRNRFDNPDPRVPKNWIVWQKPIRDRKGRWLAGYTQCTSKSLLPPEIAKRWYQTESRCQFMRFENLDEGPAPENLRITWLPEDESGLEVTHPTTGRPAASEPGVGIRNQREANWKSNHLNYIRHPAFIAIGEFRPTARQPISFSAPKQILDTQGVIIGPKKTAEIATYTSLTEWRGRRTLWYPDRKYYLLGKYLPDDLLADMCAP